MRGIRRMRWIGLVGVCAGCGLLSPNGGVPAGQPIPGVSSQPSAATASAGSAAAKPAAGGTSATPVMTGAASNKPMSMAVMAMMTMMGMDMSAAMTGKAPAGDAPAVTPTGAAGMIAVAPADGGGAPASMPTAGDGATAAAGTGAGGGPAPGGTMCPAEACEALPELPDQAKQMGYTLDPCCTPEGQCGYSRDKGMTCEFIPDSDPQCPMLEVMGFKVASCCTEDGKCGLNGKAFMMKDCGSLEDAISMFGTFVTFPDPRPCTPGMTTMPTDPMTPPPTM